MDPAQITDRRVKLALEALRKGEDLSPSELLDLRVLHQRLEAEQRPPTEANRQWALRRLLAGLVRDRLVLARGGQGGVAQNDASPKAAAAPQPADDRAPFDRLSPEQVGARLAEDFAAGEPDREAWSCLYHRYTALEPWKVAEIARVGQPGITHAARQVNRRSQRGLSLLTEVLRGLEEAALAALPPGAPAPARSAPRHNLPRRLSSFVGRGEAVGALRRLVLRSGFVTLTGPGGVGKTRLAEAVAEGLVEHYPDGVWWVEVAELSEDAALAPAIARVLEIPEQTARPMLELLGESLAERRLLLVLDNCEHLVAACRELAETLLARCPGLALLATSREPLHREGERIWEVPPLGFPAEEAEALPEALADFEAIRLFVERAEAANRAFRLSEANAASVAALCRALQGMPLAIELAAARTRALPVELILAQLADPLPLLTRGPPEAPERQRTLRAAIAWSHALLTEAEKQLFARLAVFRGGWTQDAAAAVCAGGLVRAEDLPALLYDLADKSLVVADIRDEKLRMRFLDTIRAFALEQLEAGGEQVAVSESHGAYFRDLAERAEPELTGAEQVAWLRRLDEEQANLWAALGWYERRGAVEDGLRMGGALWRFWYRHGDIVEGRGRLKRLLERANEQGRELTMAKALHAAGTLATYQSDFEAAERWLAEARQIRRALAEPILLAETITNLGNLAYLRGDYPHAQSQYIDSLTIARAEGAHKLMTTLLSNLSDLAFMRSDYAEARVLQEESLQVAIRLGDISTIAACHHRLGTLAHMQQDFVAAETHYREGLDLALRLGDEPSEAQIRKDLGHLALDSGDSETAKAAFEACVRLDRRLGDQWGLCQALNGLGRAELDGGDLDRASDLLHEALDVARMAENHAAASDALHDLGLLAWRQGDRLSARQHMTDALDKGQRVGTAHILLRWIEGIVELDLADGHRQRALLLDAACRAQRQRLGASRRPSPQARQLAEAWNTVPLPEQTDLERRGAAIALSEAVSLAIQWSSEASVAVGQ